VTEPLRHGDAANAEAPLLPPERLLHDWRAAHDRATGYLDALEVPPAEAGGLAWQAVADAALAPRWEPGAGAIAATLARLRRLLVATQGDGASADDEGFLRWRVARMLAGGGSVRSPLPTVSDGMRAAPPLERGHMTPHFSRPDAEALRRRRRTLPWARAARRRHLALVLLVLVPSAVASSYMAAVLPQQGRTGVEIAIALVFGALFGWISIGFWTAAAGCWVLIRGDRFEVSGQAPAAGPIAADARTAILMPICEEPVERVFAGLRALHRSLERAGALEHFDFFVLSDSIEAATLVEEEVAWADWCREVGGWGRIFYRRRKVRIAKKAGNVADFCRRWGRRYRYMVVFDADSVMSGEALARMVTLMERRPDVAVIQTVPRSFGRRSLFGRVQQFAGTLYTPIFAAGLHYWQLGDAPYWGHNAILRVAPFMEHCGLARLPGKPPLGGDILSHDFVEAALLARAGHTLWIAHDLRGSWEETPATLLEEMQRDRRWCQGNLQHMRLLFREGFFAAHRAVFLQGALSYVSALIWLSFLVLSSWEAVSLARGRIDYFSGPGLFPQWPVFRPGWVASLVGVTLVLLFLPKLFSVVFALARGEARQYGGAGRLLASVVLESILATLFAPIRMAFHSRFVLLNLMGREVAWISQRREDRETTWRDALRHHGRDALVAGAWGSTVLWIAPAYFWWLTPVIVALLLSVPLSVLTSRMRLGEAARRRGLFLTPEETAPARELRDLYIAAVEMNAARDWRPKLERDGFVRAAVDPYVNALHCTLLRGERQLADRIHSRRREPLERALAEGPGALTGPVRRALLSDPALAAELHQRIWELPDEDRAARWGRPAGKARVSPPPAPDLRRDR
jgi:membrane glycosyltransferase